MNVSPRVVREYFDICRVGGGIERADLLTVLGPSDRDAVAKGGGLSWESFICLVEQAYNCTNRDPERMRVIGESALQLSGQGFILRHAVHGLPLRVLYEACRFGATANFPQCSLQMTFPTPDRMRLTALIPPRLVGHEGLHFITQGSLRNVPTLLGLPPAILESSDVGPSRSVTMLRTPVQPSLRQRVKRRIDAALHAGDTIAIYEQQRKEIAEFVDQVDRATGELRAVLEALPGPVFLVRAGAIVWANRAAARTLGYDAATELGGLRFVDHVSLPDRATVDAELARRETIAPTDSLFEIALLTRAGEEVHTELSLGEIVTFEGAPAQLVVARDVSERVHMQRRLVTANRLASVGMLAAGVAHEINNPLSYIFWNLDVIGRALKGGVPSTNGQASHPPHLHSYEATNGQTKSVASIVAGPAHTSLDAQDALAALTIVREGVERVRTVVRDLRTLAQPDERAVEQVDVHAALESTLALVGRQLASRTRVVREYSDTLPPVRANRARLGQVFLNLVTNAIAAMEAGDAHENALVLRTRTHDDHHVAIEIADTGHGVAPEDAERIFEPFFTTKPIGRGTGLGLAICQRITTDLGGEITLARTSAQGTTFRLVLPAES